jgi:hypothetical protein
LSKAQVLGVTMDKKKKAFPPGPKPKNKPKPKPKPKPTGKKGKEEKKEEKEPESEVWGSSRARLMVIDWIQRKKNSLTATAADDKIYFSHAEFVKFRQADWLRRLGACRRIVQKKLKRAARDTVLYNNFREKNPRKTHNNFGQEVMRGSDAEAALLKELEKGTNDKYPTPSAFRQSNPLFQRYTTTQFRDRICQYKRSSKFKNYVKEEAKKKHNLE